MPTRVERPEELAGAADRPALEQIGNYLFEVSGLVFGEVESKPFLN